MTSPRAMRGGTRSSADTDSSRLRAALEATARGRVFLLGVRSKRPRAGEVGYNQRATTDASQIRLGFASDPDANYGVIPHPGLFVLDDDGGMLPGPLPPTLTVFTGGEPKNGRLRQHQWFTLPIELRGHQVKGKQAVVDGVDIIGSSGSPHYVVGAGCIHPDTERQYTWAPGLTPDDMPVATAPPKLLALLHAHKLLVNPTADAGPTPLRSTNQPSALRISQSKPQNPDLDTSIGTAVTWIKRQYGLSRIADGQRRQDTLARCGFYLHRQGLSGEDAVRVLLAVNRQICDPPLPLSRFNGLAERIDKKPCGAIPALSPEARPAIRQLHRAVRATTWRGPRAINAKKLLLLWIDTARRTDELTVAISDMRAAELAGMGYKTAGRARRYLIAHGWLLPHHGGGRGRTSAHTLTLPAPETRPTDTLSAPGKNRIDDPTISYGEGGLVGQTILFSADQFRQGQGRFGAIGLQILQALDTGTTYKNAAVLARSLRLLSDTVQKKLKLLAKFNLAVKRKDGWRRGPAALEVTYNARDRDRVLHRAERVLHHANLAACGIEVEVDTPTIRLEELLQHGLTRRPGLLRALLAAKNDTAPDLAAKILPDYGADRKVVLIDAYRNTPTAGTTTVPVCERSAGHGTRR